MGIQPKEEVLLELESVRVVTYGGLSARLGLQNRVTITNRRVIVEPVMFPALNFFHRSVVPTLKFRFMRSCIMECAVGSAPVLGDYFKMSISAPLSTMSMLVSSVRAQEAAGILQQYGATRKPADDQ